MTTSIYSATMLGLITPEDLWATATLLFAALSVSIIGVNLFLRRLSLLGDALSHAVLPGVVAGAVLFASTNSVFILCGALVAAILSVVMMRSLIHLKLTPEAALGTTFTTFFALGVLGLNTFGSHIDLDPGCLLYGSLELTSLETTAVLGVTGVPHAAISSFLTLLAVVLVTVVQRRNLMVTAIEPERAALSGSKLSNLLSELLFIGVAAAAVVNCFFAVGAIATTGIIVSPAVIARLFSGTLRRMWLIVLLSTVVISVTGYAGAIVFDTPVAGAVSAVGFISVLLAALVSPNGGIVTTFLRTIALRSKVLCDDLLADRYRMREEPTIFRRTDHRLLELWLTLTGLLKVSGELSNAGLLRAQALVRSHRVWEDYLARQLSYPADHVHEPSHRMEHFLTPELTESAAAAGSNDTDPHGRPIPPAPYK